MRVRSDAARQRSRRSEAGFTLLEVLIAFAILAAALGALLHGVSSAASASHVAKRYDRALAIAEARLALILSNPEQDFGAMEGAEGDFRWRAELSPHASDERTGLDLAQATVVVRFDGAAEDARTVRISALQLRRRSE